MDDNDAGIYFPARILDSLDMEESTRDSFPFLKLPQEIRNIIYEKVIEPHEPREVDVVRTISDAVSCKSNKFKKLWYKINRRRDVWTRMRLPKTTSYGLFLANRQINSEIREAIRIFNNKGPGITYSMNLLLRQDWTDRRTGVFADWVSFPAPLQYIRHVEVIAWRSPPKKRHPDDYRIFYGHQICPIRLISLLSSFLLHGPGLTHERRTFQGPLPALERLTIRHLWFESLAPHMTRFADYHEEDYKKIFAKYISPSSSMPLPLTTLHSYIHMLKQRGNMCKYIKVVKASIEDRHDLTVVCQRDPPPKFDDQPSWNSHGWDVNSKHRCCRPLFEDPLPLNQSEHNEDKNVEAR